MTCAVPAATAVIVPPDDTVATPVSELEKSIAGFATVAPSESSTLTASVCVAPRDANVTDAGVAVTVNSGITVTMDVPDAPSTVARTATSPVDTAVTTPPVDTVATVASALLQVIVGFDTGVPPASSTVAESATVRPTRTVTLGGKTPTEDAVGATVTVALPEAPPAVAVIVADPGETAVTVPATTEATPGADEDQVTGSTPAEPFESPTVATRLAVEPIEVSVAVDGVTRTEVIVGGPAESDPPQAERTRTARKSDLAREPRKVWIDMARTARGT